MTGVGAHTIIAVIARSKATKQPRGLVSCCGGDITKPLGCFAYARNDGVGVAHTITAVIARSEATKQPRGLGGAAVVMPRNPWVASLALAMTVLAHTPSPPSLRGAKRQSNPGGW